MNKEIGEKKRTNTENRKINQTLFSFLFTHASTNKDTIMNNYKSVVNTVQLIGRYKHSINSFVLPSCTNKTIEFFMDICVYTKENRRNKLKKNNKLFFEQKIA